MNLTEADLFQLVECVKESDWNGMSGKPDYDILNKIAQNAEGYLKALKTMKEDAKKWEIHKKIKELTRLTPKEYQNEKNEETVERLKKQIISLDNDNTFSYYNHCADILKQILGEEK